MRRIKRARVVQAFRNKGERTCFTVQNDRNTTDAVRDHCGPDLTTGFTLLNWPALLFARPPAKVGRCAKPERATARINAAATREL